MKIVNSSTHVELIPVNSEQRPFLISRVEILSVTSVETTEKAWWSKHTDADVCIITCSTIMEEQKNAHIVVVNSYQSLKNFLV